MKYFLLTIIPIGVFLCLGSITVFAEIRIDYPSERVVFQRDKNNSATVYIAGMYNKIVDRVEARLTPVDGYQGESTPWTPIQSNVQGGTYSGSIQGKGGWYRLEVRGWKGDQLVDTGHLDRIGIGEVFLIAGQSNAQGFKGFGGPGAQDDRVSCINYDNSKDPTSNLKYPQFSQLYSDADISPRGNSSWAWGKLGDVIASRYQVPVLFYNVGWIGSAIKNWRESLDGSTTASIYDGSALLLPGGNPYANMKSVLQYYVSITGIRGVLWIQGEADNDRGTNTDEYFNDLKKVIEKSRNDTGRNITWMVALTSYNNSKGISNSVIEGQKRVISSVPNVFMGPNTDQIDIPRRDRDGVHFTGDGLSQLGEAFANQINDDFFARSEPYGGLSPLKVNISCGGNNTLNLSVATDGYNSFSWNDGQTSSQIQVSNQSYRASARDSKGNIVVSPEIRAYDIQPPQPIISIEGTNPICKDNSATLVSSVSEGVTWNTGAEDSRLSVNTAGEYSVTAKNVYGCQTTSAKTVITVLDTPLPAKPSITVAGAVVFCDGGEVKLTSTSTVKSLWSNGAGDVTISVKSSGDYRVKAVDDKGCYSPDSDPVTVKVNPLPAKPVVSLSGPGTFCANENVILTSSYDTGNTWSTAATTKTITINTTGDFTLKQTDVNGCQSTSDVVQIKVNPLPATPAVTSLRPTTFCDRDYTTLQSSNAFSYLWSNGATDKQIDVRNSGDFTVSAKDANGCLSPPSPALKVTKNPLPPTPKILADGPTTFCADLQVVLTADDASGYLWSNGSTTKSVTIKQAGAFTVKTINEFNCTSDPSAAVRTQTLALPPSPTIRALGITTFCDGNSVELVATKGTLFFWNTGEENDTLEVLKSGDYSAKVKDQAGCFSPYSNSIAVDAKPQPATPEIVKTGVYTLVSKNNLEEGEHVWKLDGVIQKETSDMIKASQSGSYVVSHSVIYSSTLTCTSDFSDPYVMFIDKNDLFVVYPNPTGDGKITIETLSLLFNSQIQIIDVKGNVHKTFNVTAFDKPYSFNLSDLTDGLYFVKINSGTFTAIKKMMIAK